MPNPTPGFEQRILRLKADLAEQGRRVQQMVEKAVEAVFERKRSEARQVLEHDEIIDKVDVEIERAAVELLVDVSRVVAALDERQIRWILTIVKVNNELERIADEACSMCEHIDAFVKLGQPLPERFRVMANSVIGIVQSAIACFDKVDMDLARVVLASDDAVDEFEQAILREMQQSLVDGKVSVDFAFTVNSMAAALDRVDDHCTNIAEQVIYVATGKIVRHLEGHWTAPEPPA